MRLCHRCTGFTKSKAVGLAFHKALVCRRWQMERGERGEGRGHTLCLSGRKFQKPYARSHPPWRANHTSDTPQPCQICPKTTVADLQSIVRDVARNLPSVANKTMVTADKGRQKFFPVLSSLYLCQQQQQQQQHSEPPRDLMADEVSNG